MTPRAEILQREKNMEGFILEPDLEADTHASRHSQTRAAGRDIPHRHAGPAGEHRDADSAKQSSEEMTSRKALVDLLLQSGRHC
jgi:hypothetical protein